MTRALWFVVALLALPFAGCSAAGPAGALYPGDTPSGAARLFQSHSVANKTIFVADGNDVTDYGLKNDALEETIPDSMARYSALAFDRAGNLYVLGGSNVSVYAPGNKTALRTYPGKGSALTIDGSNDLYVAYPDRSCHGRSGGSVQKFAGASVAQSICDRIDQPASVATDAANNVYVANAGSGSVSVYAPNGTTTREITGLNHPFDLKFDGRGNLFVATRGGIFAYARGSSHKIRTYPSGLSMAFDSAYRFYVGSSSLVTVYKPNSTTVLRTMPQGKGSVMAFAFDATGNVYAANWGTDDTHVHPGSITVYAPNSATVLRTITTDVVHPSALAIGY